MPSTHSLAAFGLATFFCARTASGAPTKGSRPVSASYSTTPTLYQSVAGVSVSPAACSGAM